jgi:hypothetical protein
MRWIRAEHNLHTCTSNNLAIMYAEVMFGKRVN